MVYWKERVKFCGMCGSKTIIEDFGRRAFCTDCNSNFFPHTDPAIIVIVSHKDKCLLARQASWVEKRYSTIAGFVEPGESLENAVAREVFEETGIKIENIKLSFFAAMAVSRFIDDRIYGRCDHNINYIL